MGVALHHGKVAVAVAVAHAEHRHQSGDQGGSRADSDQAVHVGGAVPQGLQSHGEKLAVEEQHRHAQQQLGQRVGEIVALAVEPVGQGQTEHMAHGHIHQGDEESHAPDEPGLHAGQLILHGIGGFLGRAGGAFLLGKACSVTRIDYGLYNFVCI